MHREITVIVFLLRGRVVLIREYPDLRVEMSEEVAANNTPELIIKKAIQITQVAVLPEVNMDRLAIHEPNKGSLTPALIELQIKLPAQDQNMVLPINQERAITNDPQIRDRHHRPPDHHLIPVHRDLQVRHQVDPEEVPPADLIRDHQVEEGQERGN